MSSYNTYSPAFFALGRIERPRHPSFIWRGRGTSQYCCSLVVPEIQLGSGQYHKNNYPNTFISSLSLVLDP